MLLIWYLESVLHINEGAIKNIFQESCVWFYKKTDELMKPFEINLSLKTELISVSFLYPKIFVTGLADVTTCSHYAALCKTRVIPVLILSSWIIVSLQTRKKKGLTPLAEACLNSRVWLQGHLYGGH